MNRYDIAVIGGGMVGAAIAIGFAQQAEVLLLSKAIGQTFEPSQAMDIRIRHLTNPLVA